MAVICVRAARPLPRARWLFLAGILVSTGCSETLQDPSLAGEIPFTPDRPLVGEAQSVPFYTQQDPIVLAAQYELPTGLDLQQKVVSRTCGPTNGVCHNQKEYPDLHTPANFLSAIGAPCNVQAGTHSGVFDRCERAGDGFAFGDHPAVEIGYLERVPGKWDEMSTPNARTPGLHLHLAASVPEKRMQRWARGRFVRAVPDAAGNPQQLAYFEFSTQWNLLEGGRHVFGRVRPYQVDDVEQLLGLGVIEGDQNRNGIYGAKNGNSVTLLNPGQPERSYLIARLRGMMEGEAVPGSRMPLANQPLSVSEMLALFCFVEGLDPGQAVRTLATGIDYVNCSYSAHPETLNLLGAGVTWQQRIRNILEFNCGGCHAGAMPAAGLPLVDGAIPGQVYARLRLPSSQVPALNLVEPGDPARSYLWLKLSGDPSIVGQRMPLRTGVGPGMLTQPELDDIRTWIEAGAVESQ